MLFDASQAVFGACKIFIEQLKSIASISEKHVVCVNDETMCMLDDTVNQLNRCIEKFVLYYNDFEKESNNYES